nr:FliM/FliN family flagellar motor switch protein [uncultured Enterobacter sp.]
MSRLKLRAVNMTEQRLNRRCGLAGEAYLRREQSSDRRYIRIWTLRNNQSVALYCDAAALLVACSASPADLPIELIDDGIIIGLAKRYFACNGLFAPFSRTPVENYRVEGFIDGASLSYPLIGSTEGSGIVWCELDDVILPEAQQVANDASWENITLPVEILLGKSSVRQDDLIGLRAGDVIIVAEPRFIAVIANKKVKLNFDGESMSVESMDDSDFFGNERNISDAADAPFSIRDLNVTVEFILAQETMTLDALQCMQVNDLLPLNIDEAKVNVRLRVGQHIVASGELVYVNDKLAVEIQKINGSVRS